MDNLNFDMLLVARSLRQMTQEEVCSQTGISQSLLSKLENGLKKSVQEDILDKLSNAYRLPKSHFYRSKDASPESHLYFRRKLSMSPKTIDAFVAKIRIIKMGLDDLLQAVDIHPYVFDSYSTKEFTPSEIADKTRYKLKVYRGPIPHLVNLLENNGVIVFKMDFGTDEIDGLSSITNRGYKIIFLNANMPNDRIRRSLAHELGHLIMHFDYTPMSPDQAEKEADEFASQFLMPEKEIKPMLYNLKMSSLAELKRIWKVSMRTLIRRAKDLEAITPETYRTFQIEFSRRKYNKTEPIPLLPENPSLVKSIFELYIEELCYSTEDLLELMRINKEDYNEWFMPKQNKIIHMNFRI